MCRVDRLRRPVSRGRRLESRALHLDGWTSSTRRPRKGSGPSPCSSPRSSPSTCSGTSPRSSLCPAKTTTASAPASTPSISRDNPGGASGDVTGSTQGSCALTSAPAASAASRNGSAGVFLASSESLMNAQPSRAIFEPFKLFPTSRSADSVKCTICPGMKSLMPRARV